MTPWWTHVPAWIGGGISCGVGTADLWRFHGLPMWAELVFLVAGLMTFGVSFAGMPVIGPPSSK